MSEETGGAAVPPAGNRGLVAAERLLQHVRAISQPRLTGSPAEAEAAVYVEEQLRKWGLVPRVERFLAVADMNWFPISAAVFLLAGVAVYPGAGWARWLGASLSAGAALLLLNAMLYADSPLRFLLPRVESRSVIARIPPRGERERRAAVVAHLDSNRCRLNWHAGKARTIKWGAVLSVLVYAAVAISLAIGAALGSWSPYFVALAGGGYALASLIVLAADLRRPVSPGANDNAASVATALGLAETLAAAPLESTEVWFLFTGAEESDHRGLKEVLNRLPELGEARFFVLEGVGAGELSYLTREGVVGIYRPAPELLALAAALGEKLGVKGREMVVVCETLTLRRLGYKAITISGYDPDTASLPHWHLCDDLPEHISPAALARAQEFLLALLAALDGGG